VGQRQLPAVAELAQLLGGLFGGSQVGVKAGQVAQLQQVGTAQAAAVQRHRVVAKPLGQNSPAASSQASSSSAWRPARVAARTALATISWLAGAAAMKWWASSARCGPRSGA
jgi:hypothetical protein